MLLVITQANVQPIPNHKGSILHTHGLLVLNRVQLRQIYSFKCNVLQVHIYEIKHQ